jgi:hypothetical protein
MQVQQLKLTKHSCADSAELLTWCDRNTNRCYITRVAAETSGKSRWIQASAGESVRPANYKPRTRRFPEGEKLGTLLFPPKRSGPSICRAFPYETAQHFSGYITGISLCTVWCPTEYDCVQRNLGGLFSLLILVIALNGPPQTYMRHMAVVALTVE